MRAIHGNLLDSVESTNTGSAGCLIRVGGVNFRVLRSIFIVISNLAARSRSSNVIDYTSTASPGSLLVLVVIQVEHYHA